MKFPFSGRGRSVGDDQFSKANLKFSMTSPELKFPFSGRGRSVGMIQFSKANLKFSKSSPELKFPFFEGVGLA